MAKLILIRHGQSQWNLEDLFAGFTDVPLTALGQEQARAAGEKVKASGIIPAAVFTSTLERAWHTAELVVEVLGLNAAPIRSDELRERDYGDLVGQNREACKIKYGEEQVRVWRRSYSVAPPNGENLADVVARAQPYYEKHILPLLTQGKDVAIVAHGNTIRALMVALRIYTPETIEGFEISVGKVLGVEFSGGTPTQHDYL